MTLKELFDSIPPKERTQILSILRQYPELSFSSIQRLERKIKVLKERDRQGFEKIFVEEQNEIKKKSDRLLLAVVKKRIAEIKQ